MIILDTNIVSEFSRPVPDPVVRRWMQERKGRTAWITTVTVAELLYGIEICPPGKRRRLIDESMSWLIRDLFADRILPFDVGAAEVYAVIAADRRRAGRPVSQPDLQIASIALDRGAALVTRNGRDFHGYGLDVLDPWTA